MPIVYKLINPVNDTIYYVGFTTQTLQQRLIGHLVNQNQKTTKDLVSSGLKPKIECIEEGEGVSMENEMYWIQRLTNEGVYLENRDGVINYQNRDWIFDMPTELLNTIEMPDYERYKAAIDLVLSEMPRSVSVPILIRIKTILEWATKN
jgi:hypothetical protein